MSGERIRMVQRPVRGMKDRSNECRHVREVVDIQEGLLPDFVILRGTEFRWIFEEGGIEVRRMREVLGRGHSSVVEGCRVRVGRERMSRGQIFVREPGKGLPGIERRGGLLREGTVVMDRWIIRMMLIFVGKVTWLRDKVRAARKKGAG